ncbi:methyltransferase domain-containing protein [Streptomyces sp. NBC_01443]|uniref:class I SAM-dependent methyltransferase n=1 Tax=Streptomyces sp. NBC_01443 TaxID=2903868 RepID=UPI00224F0080|nr:methyltransferase domain-containing protein [Streptomyces sp. NBC_01443]MCX4628506.1 methyltransferase domain-containing protein [Streptomyces sp. NBC_01443]
MPVQHSKAALHAFYADALRSGRSTGEKLGAPVPARFLAQLASLPADTPRRALDLGYGAGAYTIALAEAGFAVVAVDQAPAEPLLHRLSECEGLAERVTVVESLIEQYPIQEDFGVLVAKDVLHYLSQHDVEALLTQAVERSRSVNMHYLEVFTEISRTDAHGVQIHIEGEARYTPESFSRALERIYKGWDVTVNWDDHTEQDTRSRRTYFKAARATVTAARRCPVPVGTAAVIGREAA